MALKKEIVKSITSYTVNLTVEEFLRLTDYEKQNDNPLLYDELIKVEGLDGCDYNGHFGPYIYFDLEREYDTPATWREIEEIINPYIQE